MSTGCVLMWQHNTEHFLLTVWQKNEFDPTLTARAQHARTAVDMCSSMVEAARGPRRRNTLYDSRRVKRGPGALRIKERISLLINILFLRWKFQVVVIRKKENTQSSNSLRFLWRRICSRAVNLSFMGRARGPRSFCFPNGLEYKHAYFL